MRKEMLYAVRSAAAQAKNNLAASVRTAKAVFGKVARNEAAAARRSAASRASIARKLRSSTKAAKRSLRDAVSGLNRSMLALKSETAKKIKKTNRGIDAYANKMARNARAVQAAMKANVASLTSKIDAALKSAMSKAQRRANRKFGKAYRKLAKDRAHADTALAGAVNRMNDGLAKQAALADARFSHTVKNIAAARAQARNQVAAARRSFTTAMVRVTSEVKDQETRLSGEIAVVSGEVVSNRAAQMRVNRRTGGELKRITKLANDRRSASIRARGKLRKLLDENKKAASAEVQALTRSTRRAINAVRSQAARNAQDAAKDLTRATKKLYGKLAGVQRKTLMMNKRNSARIAAYSARSRASLYSAKRQFGARLSTLTNTVTANNRKTESLLAGLTGVIRDNKMAAAKDRALMRAQSKAMNADLNKKLVRSIQMGEARAKKAADRAREHLASTKRSVLIEISERVERTADKLFKTIQ